MHLSAENKGSTSKANSISDELIINNEHILYTNTIAFKLNVCFSSIAQILNRNSTGTNQLDHTKLINYVNNKSPDNTYSNIPYITTEQVFSVINAIDTSKATGLDCIGMKIIKLAANCLSPVIAELKNKTINSGSFSSHLKSA